MIKKLKKPLIVSVIISGLLSLLVFAVEGISAYKFGMIPIGKVLWGGEYKGYIGIGWNLTKLYPMTDSGAHANASVTVSFNPNIFLFFIVAWIAAFAVSYLIFAKKKQ